MDNIPPNIADSYSWKLAFAAAAMKSDNPNIVLIGNCVRYHGSSETTPERILQFTKEQQQAGKITGFDEAELLQLSRAYASELSNFEKKVITQREQIIKEQRVEAERVNRLPVGEELPFTSRSQAARQGLAKSDQSGGDKESHLKSSILNSNLEQIVKTYLAAGINEWKKDIKLIDDCNYPIDPIVQKLSSSEDPFAAELKNVCIDAVKAKPTPVIKDIVRKLNSLLHLSVKSDTERDEEGLPVHYAVSEEDKGPYLKPIKEKIDLYEISGEDLMQAIIQPILYGEKGSSNGGIGIQHMNSGSPQFDVERFFNLLNYLEQVSGYRPDREQVSKAIFEKSLSKFTKGDSSSLPSTENIVYLTGLPKALNIDINSSDLVKQYGDEGYFNLALITTLDRAIKTGGGIIEGYNSEYMTMFCNQYKDYLDFDNTNLQMLINSLKDRDETGTLSKYTAKEILLNKKLGEKLYSQVSKDGSPGDLPLINSIRELTGKDPFWLENTD